MLDAAQPKQYAVVAYLNGPVAKFVEDLRAELHPPGAHLRAHVTILPPRPILASEEVARVHLRRLASRFTSFEIDFDDVETFAPATPTVFIRVSTAAHRFRDMHIAFNHGPLHYEEPWPYIPHLTIVKMDDLIQSAHALEVSRRRWSAYSGQRPTQVEEFTFVREDAGDRWVDLETIQLKRK